MSVAIDPAVLDKVFLRTFDEAPADDILRWGFDTFAPRIALSASFGSPEGMVLLDMMFKISPAHTRVFTIDSGRMHQETYELMDRVRNRYGLTVEIYFPRAEAVQAMVREHGMDLFYDSVELRKMCCGVRKVEPLERALAGLDAWITGLRPSQSVTRADVRAVKGSSAISDVALSPAPSRASRPPMIRIVVEAKKLGLVDRFCTTTASSTRTSRLVACNIQSRRTRLPAASSDACAGARRLANRA